MDFFKINKELKNKGLNYNEKDLLIFKEKIIQNLLLIKESKNEDTLIKENCKL